jgi:hypothetical protein
MNLREKIEQSFSPVLLLLPVSLPGEPLYHDLLLVGVAVPDATVENHVSLVLGDVFQQKSLLALEEQNVTFELKNEIRSIRCVRFSLK